MFLGLAIGFFLCFYGSRARKFLLPLRSIFSGALISLAIALLIINGKTVFSSLAMADPFHSVGNLLWDIEDYTHPLMYLVSFSLGGLLMFFLSRKQQNSIGFLVKILTGLSMGLAIFLLLRSLFSLSLSLLFSLILLFFILYLCLRGFEYYFAMESALAGALLVSYMVTRFWYLDIWLFFVWATLLTILGIFSQIRSIRKEKETTKTNE
jgi:hypothetical protein